MLRSATKLECCKYNLSIWFFVSKRTRTKRTIEGISIANQSSEIIKYSNASMIQLFRRYTVLFILVNLLAISLYKVYRVNPFKGNRVTLSSVKYLDFQSNYRSRYFLSRATHRSGASAWTQCPALRIVVSIWFGNNNAIWSMCECRTNRDCPPLIINTSPYTSRMN